MAGSAGDLLARAAAARFDAQAAARLGPLVELTALGPEDDPIERLCARARQAVVAAVRVTPDRVPLAARSLRGGPVRLTSVANFPGAGDDLGRIAEEVAAAVAAGAVEIAVLAPVEALLAGDVGLVGELVEACRAAAAGQRLQISLETGRLAQPAAITAAARTAIMAGVDGLWTGLTATGATLEQAAIVMAVIEEAGGRVAIGLSADIASTGEAAAHLHLLDHFMGEAWVGPETVRLIASTWWDQLRHGHDHAP